MELGKIFLVFVLFLIVIFTPTLFEYSIKEKEAFLDDDYYYYKEKDTLYNTNDKCDIVCARLGKSADVCKSYNGKVTCINNITGKKKSTTCSYYNNRCVPA